MKNNYPEVSIVTVNFNGKKHLKKFFDSVFRLNYPKNKLDIIFVDNVSTDGSVELVKKDYSKVRVIRNDINNYCKALNLGAEASNAKYLALLNNDTRVAQDWLIELVKVIDRDKRIAAVGSKLLNMSGKIQNAAHYELPNFYWDERGAGQERKKYNTVDEVPSLCGAAVLYRRDALFEVGLFDEDFVIYGEDVDISLRLRQRGYNLLFVPTSIVYHKFHGTADEEFSRYYIERNRLLFLAKHYPHKLSSSLLGDGYFTIKKSIDSLGKIYSVFPDIIIKLIKTHSLALAKDVSSELFAEINKLVNYENALLVKKFNEMALDQKRTHLDKTQTLEELKQRIKDVAQKDKELSEKKDRLNHFEDKLANLALQLKSRTEQASNQLKTISDKEEELRQKTSEILLKDKQLQGYRESLQNREAQLVERERELSKLREELNTLSEQLREKRDDVLSKENQIKEYAAAIHTKDGVLEEKEGELVEREKELSKLREEFTNISTQLRLKTDEVLFKNGQLIEKDTYINGLDKEIDKLTTQIQEHLDSLQSKDSFLEEKEGQLLERERELSKLREELNTLSEQLREKRDDVLSKENQIKEHTESIHAKDGVLEAKEDELVEREKELSRLREEFNNLSVQLREKADEVLFKNGQLIEKDTYINGLNKEINKLTTQIQEHLDSLQSKDSFLEEKEGQLLEREKELTKLKEELNTLSEQLREKRDDVLSKESQIKEHTESIHAKDGVLEAKEDELVKRENELSKLRDELHSLSTELKQKADEVLFKNGQLIEKDTYINGLDKEIDKLTTQIQEHLDSLQSKDRFLEEKEGELVEREKELSKLKEELNTLSEQLREKTDEFATLTIQVRKSMNEVMLKDSQIIEKDGQLSELENQVNRLSRELSQKQEDLSRKEDLFYTKEKELSDYREELDSLSNQLRLRMEEVFIKEDQLIEKRTEIDELKSELASLSESVAQGLVSINEKNSQLAQKEDLISEREKELTYLKDEFKIISNQLRQRMDEVLIKDGELIEKDNYIVSLNNEVKRLNEEVQQHLNNLKIKEDLLSKRENERTAFKDELNIITNQLRQRMDEVLIKDGQLIEKDNYIAGLNNEVKRLNEQIQQHLNTLKIKEDILSERENELTAFKDELNIITNQLRQRMDEVLIKDGELIEKDNYIVSLNNEVKRLNEEIQQHLNNLKIKEDLLSERENELTAFKDELNIISNQLRQRMDEVLIKDGQLIEKNNYIAGLSNDIKRLNEEIQQHLNTIEIREGMLSERENELTAFKDEVNILSNQLRQRMDEVLIKDGELIEKRVEMDELKNELSSLAESVAQGIVSIDEKDSQLAQKDNYIVSLNNEVKRLNDELKGIYNSKGFRFIRRLSQMFWLTIAIILTPIFLFLTLAFLLEYLGWLISKPLLKRFAPKRKNVSIKAKKISLVMPNYNGIDCLRECLPSIFACEEFKDGQNEVLLVDDGSTDGSVHFITENFPQVSLIRNKKNRGFGFTCNRGVRAAKNEIVVLINNDIILTKDFLQPLLCHLQKEDVFVVTPKLYAWDRKTFVWGMHIGRFEQGYIRLWNERETGNGDRINRASPSIFAIGGAMVFRKSDFLWLGGFDSIYRPNCWEDIDISYRAWKRGLKVLYEPRSLMYHKGRATLTYERPKEIKNELLYTWKNITDGGLLKEHLKLLPWNLYRHRMNFLKGFFWALSYLPQTLFHRLLERRFIVEFEDRKIFNKIMHYYRNFVRRGFRHLEDEKPNVLMVSRFLPYPLNAGGKIRIHTLIKLLSDKYNFLLLSLIDHEDELKHLPSLKALFTEIYPVLAKSPLNLNFISRFFYPELYKIGYSYSQELVDKLKEIQKAKPIDIIHIESNELLYLMDHIKHIPITYTEHDISILSSSSSYYKKNGHFVWSLFDHLKKVYFHASLFKKIDKVITLSKEDLYVLRSFFPKADISLIPTGVDLKHFSFENSSLKKSKKIIFVGHYRHYPNEDAVVYFVKKIFPIVRRKIQDVEFLIVGSGITSNVEHLAKEKNVVLVGEVSDVKPYLDQAVVFVNSIRISAGIKGKVLEAMAAGVPVVSTQVGSSGIDAQPEKELLIANGPRGFAIQVIRLLKDDRLREKLITNARQLVEEKYDWLTCAGKLDKLYRSLLFEKQGEDLELSKIQEIMNRTNDFIEQKIEELDGHFIKPEEGPEELHMELTYNCNSKCIMCDLWDYNKRIIHRPDDKELSLDEIRRFVEESEYLHKTKVVVLSGGEPFLRKDIVELCGFFKGSLPHSSIGILTNGVQAETIITKTKEILDRFHPRALWLGSSLDGVGKEHDRIRGTEGAFLSLHRTIELCKKELPNVKFSVTFTLTPYNINQLLPAKQFAEREGLDFFAQFVVPKEAREKFIWTSPDLKLAEKEVMQIIQELTNKMDCEGIKDKHLISQLYFWSHLVKYQTNPQRFFKKCVSGSKFAMLTPYGDLFFCPSLKDKFIGNVREEKFDYLWMSARAQELRSFIEKGDCHCWLVCIVFPLLERALS